MLSRYDLTTEQNKRNAIFEVNQQVILAGLYSGGFFESAAFYGGTCPRIFMGCNALVKIWTFLYSHRMMRLISANISNPLLMHLLW